MGISQLIEGEEGESIVSRHKGDRKEIGLPESQIEPGSFTIHVGGASPTTRLEVLGDIPMVVGSFAVK